MALDLGKWLKLATKAVGIAGAILAAIAAALANRD